MNAKGVVTNKNMAKMVNLKTFGQNITKDIKCLHFVNRCTNNYFYMN